MPISDVWADWTTTPNSNTPAGSAIPEIDDEFRNVKAELKKNCVTLTGNQTIAGTKTFGSFPELSTAAPTTGGQAANKKYVDDKVAAGLQSLVPSGTCMPFYEATAPTGWTQAAINDRVLRVVSGEGGGLGGSWTISGISVDYHGLTNDELPQHSHTYWKADIATTILQAQEGQGTQIQVITGLESSDTGVVGAYFGHTHGLTIGSSWRPAYLDIILCTRD